MLDYASLAAVAAVVREGSFERAARVLNVTTSAVSQRVKQLEERLGSVLCELRWWNTDAHLHESGARRWRRNMRGRELSGVQLAGMSRVPFPSVGPK